MRGTWCGGQPSQFFDLTESDSIGLAQGAIDGPCLRDAHFSTVNYRRNVGRIGIPIAFEALRSSIFEDDRLKNPTALIGIRVNSLQYRFNSYASASLGNMK